jgi:soluble lytic murein transglycosylase-like protein
MVEWQKVGFLRGKFGRGCLGTALLCASAASAWAAEHIVLRNGFDLLCDHRESSADGNVRLFLAADAGDFMEVNAADIVSVEPAPDLPRGSQASSEASARAAGPDSAQPTAAEMRQMLARAGAAHDLDVDLLASVVRAESGGNARAVSRTGARGLMQLMPGTAAEMGVRDSFHPDENINGGTAYLNSLLARYHDDLALALAAYNAGPAAVDRYHGIPPYRETRAYVARVIHEFNRRKAERAAAARAHGTVAFAAPAPAGSVPPATPGRAVR